MTTPTSHHRVDRSADSAALRYTKDSCPDHAKHTKCPTSEFAEWSWVERKYRTHYQTQCPTCHLWTIWRKRDKPLTKAQVEADLYPHTEHSA